MMESLRAWWSGLAPRERLIIAGGGALLLVSLLYAYLWLPIASERLRLKQQLPELRAAASQMQADAAEVIRLKATANTEGSGGSVQTNVETSATAQGLRDRLRELTSPDPNHVRLASASIPFDQWLSWVARLQAEFGIRVESAQVDALPDSGLVKIQATLAGPGS